LRSNPASSGTQSREDHPFRVLVVCTANQGRSPMIQLMLARALAELHVPWTVDSAGTAVTGGSRVLTTTTSLLAEIGIDASDFEPKALTRSAADSADLILTATVEHRRLVVEARPAALTKTFTLLQFARYCTAVQLASTEVTRLGDDLMAGVVIARSRFQPIVPGADDIPDPASAHLRAFRETRGVIAHAIEQITRPLAACRIVASTSGTAASRPTDSSGGGITTSSVGSGGLRLPRRRRFGGIPRSSR
jgi:protein-tyrosine phosphatase